MALGGVLSGFDPLSLAGMQDTYDVWLRNQFGASPLAYAYGQSQSPWAGLQYLSSPLATDTGAFGGINQYTGIANPFMSWLGEGTGALGAQDWMRRAQNVSNALNRTGFGVAGGTMDDALMNQVYERFGAANDQAEARQRQLAFAPIMANTSGALQGEMANILNRLYQNWRVQDASEQGNFLNYAMQRSDPTTGTGKGLWEQFNLTPLTKAQIEAAQAGESG